MHGGHCVLNTCHFHTCLPACQCTLPALLLLFILHVHSPIPVSCTFPVQCLPAIHCRPPPRFVTPATIPPPAALLFNHPELFSLHWFYSYHCTFVLDGFFIHRFFLHCFPAFIFTPACRSAAPYRRCLDGFCACSAATTQFLAPPPPFLVLLRSFRHITRIAAAHAAFSAVLHHCTPPAHARTPLLFLWFGSPACLCLLPATRLVVHAHHHLRFMHRTQLCCISATAGWMRRACIPRLLCRTHRCSTIPPFSAHTPAACTLRYAHTGRYAVRLLLFALPRFCYCAPWVPAGGRAAACTTVPAILHPPPARLSLLRHCTTALHCLPCLFAPAVDYYCTALHAYTLLLHYPHCMALPAFLLFHAPYTAFSCHYGGHTRSALLGLLYILPAETPAFCLHTTGTLSFSSHASGTGWRETFILLHWDSLGLVFLPSACLPIPPACACLEHACQFTCCIPAHLLITMTCPAYVLAFLLPYVIVTTCLPPRSVSHISFRRHCISPAFEFCIRFFALCVACRSHAKFFIAAALFCTAPAPHLPSA